MITARVAGRLFYSLWVNNRIVLKPKIKKLVKILSIVIGVLVVIYFGLSAYGTQKGMEIPRLPLAYDPAHLGVPYEDVAFKTRADNLTLKGWFLPGQNSDAIIIVHGGFQNRIDDVVDTGELAPALVKKGYNVLLFDMRGRGESEGKGLALSNIDEDIGGAVDYLGTHGFDKSKICILGFCSGAANTCIYASRNDIGTVILDGCFKDDKTMVRRQAESINMPGFLSDAFWPGCLLFLRIMYNFKVINPIDVVGKIKCPIFFIHEQFDEFITSAETQALLKAVGNPEDGFWEVLGAKHSEGFRTRPFDYVEQVDKFITETIGK